MRNDTRKLRVCAEETCRMELRKNCNYRIELRLQKWDLAQKCDLLLVFFSLTGDCLLVTAYW
jgi:hypothetical protein